MDCKIHLLRRPQYFLITLCVPCAAVAYTAVFGIYVSAVPKAAKATLFQLCLMTLMSISVLILAMADTSPPAAEVSRLQKFYLSLIAVVIASPVAAWIFLRLAKSRPKGSAAARSIAAAHAAAFATLLALITALNLWFFYHWYYYSG